MTLFQQNDAAVNVQIGYDGTDLKMLRQMAEALEDEAAGLDLRAASFEEQELLLTQQVEEHQTQVNRLLLRLQSIKAERNGVVEKIEKLKEEARNLKEESFQGEDEVALSLLGKQDFEEIVRLALPKKKRVNLNPLNREFGSTFFRRMTVTDLID